MRLIRIQNGLVEEDNYFLTSPSSDFLGDGLYSRTNKTFTLRDSYIERPFKQEDFVIIVEKQQDSLKYSDEISFYIRKDNMKSGLIESYQLNNPSSKFWKLTRYKEYVQGYSSDDGVDWKSVGGGGIMPLQDVQGFNVSNSKTHLKLLDYKVYRSPYTKFIGLNEGNVGVITDVNGVVIDEKLVNSDGELEIFLESVVEGTLTIYEDNTKSSKVYESDKSIFQFGDIYNVVSHQLALFYKGIVLDEKTTMLSSMVEQTVLKNLSADDIYSNILVATETDTTDTIELSLDGNVYSDELIIPDIQPSGEIDIFIKITKDSSVHSFQTRHFDLIIDV